MRLEIESADAYLVLALAGLRDVVSGLHAHQGIHLHSEGRVPGVPPAEIFTTSLDNAKTKVYSRDTGLFSSPDPNLEGECAKRPSASFARPHSTMAS